MMAVTDRGRGPAAGGAPGRDQRPYGSGRAGVPPVGGVNGPSLERGLGNWDHPSEREGPGGCGGMGCECYRPRVGRPAATVVSAVTQE
jgi:hypothetical protein